MSRKLVSLTLVWIAVLASAARAQQSASSGIVGRVTDTSQAALPGATVTVTNSGTNAQRTTMTDAEGRFSIPNLPPATYDIRVELQGFQTAELKNFVLPIGEIARPTLTLGVAAAAENVLLICATPPLQTATSSVGLGLRQKY